MKDLFADMTFGRLALAKMNPTEPNFRLFCAGWLGDNNERQVMKVEGAVFRAALSGPRKGKLCIMVPGTAKTAYVTAEEMEKEPK